MTPDDVNALKVAIEAGIGTEYLKYCDEAQEALSMLLQHLETVEAENRQLRSLADFVASRHPDGNPKFAIEAAQALLASLAGEEGS